MKMKGSPVDLSREFLKDKLQNSWKDNSEQTCNLNVHKTYTLAMHGKGALK